jgi:A/G-specific adenine glycosylase
MPEEPLVAWFAQSRRDLPWRRIRDPWGVLVSEVMLQQTQVERVVPRWHRFLARFPTVQACRDGGAGAVVEEWAGLGYNRRALNLWRCASTVCERHVGVFPAELDELLALPGVGPYTARAVLAFAFEADVGVVDTNVGRVLARRAGRRLTPREVQAAADGLVPAGRGWAHNQAMLDLGATVCVARRPACDRCPLAGGCAWGRAGCRGADPAERSAGVSGRQSRFAGSDRQGRGRLVDAVRVGPVTSDNLAAVMGWPSDPARAAAVAATVVADGLAVLADGTYRLP